MNDIWVNIQIRHLPGCKVISRAFHATTLPYSVTSDCTLWLHRECALSSTNQLPGEILLLFRSLLPYESNHSIACAFFALLPVYTQTPTCSCAPSSIEGNSFKSFEPTQILARRDTISVQRTSIDSALSSVLPKITLTLYFVLGRPENMNLTNQSPHRSLLPFAIFANQSNKIKEIIYFQSQ